MNPPPFFVSFPDCEHFKAALDKTVADHYSTEIDRLVERNLPPVASTRVLACLFGYSTNFVGAMQRRPEKYYRNFAIRKGKKTRLIDAPKVALKVIQKWFSYHLSTSVSFDSCVFGFIPGRNSAMAAQVHCNSNWVYSLDIKDFFPTTSIAQVAASLILIGYSPHSAHLIASLCCYKGFLAQGAPSSPILSNLVFKPFDRQLAAIAAEFGCNYSRYADDIVFSGKNEFDPRIKEKSKLIIEGGRWTISELKEYFAVPPQRLKVHGLLVHNEFPRLTKGYRNRIRAMKWHLEKQDVPGEDSARFRGHIAYADYIQRFADPNKV